MWFNKPPKKHGYYVFIGSRNLRRPVLMCKLQDKWFLMKFGQADQEINTDRWKGCFMPIHYPTYENEYNCILE